MISMFAAPSRLQRPSKVPSAYGVPSIVIAMPIRDTMTSETRQSLADNTGPHLLLTVVGKPVDEARNELAERVLALNPVPEFVVWIDDDAWWLPGAVELLVEGLRKVPRAAMVAGSFCKRMPNSPAVAYRTAGDPSSTVVVGRDCRENEVIAIQECGMHACAVRTSALRALRPKPFAVTNVGEDLSFCKRLRDRGFLIGCAPGVTFAHVDAGIAYIPDKTPVQIVDGSAQPLTPEEFVQRLQRLGVAVTVSDLGGARRLAAITMEPSRSYGPAMDRVRAA